LNGIVADGRAYIDSDILIAYLRKDRTAQEFLRRQPSDGADLWTGAMQRAEILFFVRPGEEPDTLYFMSKFKTATVTQEIVDEASVLFRTWNRSHGTGVADALLAATVMLTGGWLFTRNLKHYPMPGIAVSKAW
jgi:predicted nucleic acid-binding protein